MQGTAGEDLICPYIFEIKTQTHKQHSLFDSCKWTCQCWPTSKNFHRLCTDTEAMDNWDGWRERISNTVLSAQLDDIYIYKKKISGKVSNFFSIRYFCWSSLWWNRTRFTMAVYLAMAQMSQKWITLTANNLCGHHLDIYIPIFPSLSVLFLLLITLRSFTFYLLISSNTGL